MGATRSCTVLDTGLRNVETFARIGKLVGQTVPLLTVCRLPKHREHVPNVVSAHAFAIAEPVKSLLQLGGYLAGKAGHAQLAEVQACLQCGCFVRPWRPAGADGTQLGSLPFLCRSLRAWATRSVSIERQQLRQQGWRQRTTQPSMTTRAQEGPPTRRSAACRATHRGRPAYLDIIICDSDSAMETNRRAPGRVMLAGSDA